MKTQLLIILRVHSPDCRPASTAPPCWTFSYFVAKAPADVQAFRQDRDGLNNLLVITTRNESSYIYTRMRLYSIRDCAKLLGVAPHRIAYAHESGKLPEVQLWVAGKRIYTATDLKRVAKYFGVQFDPNKQDRGEEHE